ncbi:hypothetical protein LTR91_009564 [Friedmanniomyces endolithicus]|uniref:Methyltransferase type 11 domain-containing protein n=1 Tax=Friedmanniomyces endolithicus TaxID=329885 RepID=A0AAN6KKQ6_9PEZI|nr:hypothetical protein LTR57_010093 [Friedmanniomyces endolithicus]KAK0974570.1 hypothetical protein LTS01_014130 [Friedmanniomyces endolithicus]KAK0988333.1 hypothetical protein LTR91_009564 [Friedmanniomyces endolithicus]KAK1035184.1 hypothetical protein LTS16_014761 [Friedmanniomyces endolithicus]
MARRLRLRDMIGILVAGFTILFAILANGGSATPSVEDYYNSLESRLGHWLLLGNARHCGFYPPNALWPFPIARAQRTMEAKLHARLALPDGSRILHAGTGSGLVASYMAHQGLVVEGVDLTARHVCEAQRTIRQNGLEGQVTVRLGDYHDLPSTQYRNGSFDGVYTMETFVHADDPRKVLRNFHRLLRPGGELTPKHGNTSGGGTRNPDQSPLRHVPGVLVLHEADVRWDSEGLNEVLWLSHCQNTLKEGSYKQLLHETGFGEISLEDYSHNVLPLWRLFGVLRAIPYALLRLLGLQARFPNVMAGVETYRHWDQGRYVSVRAVKV